MNPADATREILWNVSYPWLMYVLLVPTVIVAGWGVYRRLRLWRRGLPEMRWDRPGERLRLVLRHAVAQGRTLRARYAGIFHLLIYTGFIVLTAATTVVMLDHDFGTSIMRGGFYLWFQSLTVDLFGGLVVVGLGMAAWRRWHKKPKRLVYTTEANRILIAVFVIVVTGFLVEGWRIAVTDDPWGTWSPLGYAVAAGSEAVAGKDVLRSAHAVMWWFHLSVTFTFLAWAPYTKLIHVLTGPLNIFFANLDGYGHALKRVDFGDDEDDEDEVPLGVNDLARMTWKDLLDLDACTECGRCTGACPAHAVGKPLSPRDIVLDLRALMHTEGAALLKDGSGNGNGPKIATIRDDNALAPASLWSCTTCAACMEACPVFIEPLPKIVDARRYLVMEEAEMPESMAEAVQSLERRGHPFPGTRLSRVDWFDGLDVPIVKKLEDPESLDVLLWVGCGNALLERNQGIVRSLAQLMTKAGVSFAILGREERCNGDPARRMGNEFLFETMAAKVIATLERYSVKKIVTSCPHCFNTFLNDYPALGGEYEVVHHSTFLSELVEAGKLPAVGSVPLGGSKGGKDSDGKSVTFHDPCYLGRYNRVFDAPRDLVRISSGQPSLEMKKNREASFCCGGGGGMAFIDEPADQRVNRRRAQQAISTGADVVGVACPFCMTMLEDGVKACAGERQVEVKDIAELLLEATSPQRLES